MIEIPLIAYHLDKLLVETGLVSSRSEAVRLIKQGAVEINKEKQEWLGAELSWIRNGSIIHIGKRKWLEIIVKPESYNLLAEVWEDENAKHVKIKKISG